LRRRRAKVKKITKWQFEQLEKELRLLQGHLSDPSCPCQTDGEHCVRKHLITIAALAAETVPIAKGENEKKLLKELMDEAQGFANIENWKICHDDMKMNIVSADWARTWAKRVEHKVTGACTITGGDSYVPLKLSEEKKSGDATEKEVKPAAPPAPVPSVEPEEPGAVEGGPTVVQEVVEEHVESTTDDDDDITSFLPPLPPLPPLPHELFEEDE